MDAQDRKLATYLRSLASRVGVEEPPMAHGHGHRPTDPKDEREEGVLSAILTETQD